MELQDFKTAGSYYSRIVEIRKYKMAASASNTKELAVAYFMLADSYLYREFLLEAETYYNKSLINAIDPAHQGDVYSRKGMIYEGMKEPEKSIDFYLSAIKKYEMSKNRNPKSRQLINKRLLKVYGALEDLYSKIEKPEKVKEYADRKMVTERLMGNTQ